MKKYAFAVSSMALSLLVMLSVIIQPLNAFAAADEEYSLTVNFTADDGEVAVEGSEFKLYLVMNQDNELIGDFEQYAEEVEVGELASSDDVGTLAKTLAAYAARDELTPVQTGNTDENGQVKFDDLESGIYLVVGSSAIVDRIKYTPMEALVRIPHYSVEGKYVTNVVIKVKYDYEQLPDENIELSVKKVWEDNNDPDRPKEVTVQLIKDGTAYNDVKLNADNGWTHTWTDLDPHADWQVAEINIPDGYSVKISRNETMFIVTNTAKEDTSGDTGDNNEDSEPEPNLPQTGQLWWPVPVLMILGVLIVLIGIVIRNFDLDEKK